MEVFMATTVARRATMDELDAIDSFLCAAVAERRSCNDALASQIVRMAEIVERVFDSDTDLRVNTYSRGSFGFLVKDSRTMILNLLFQEAIKKGRSVYEFNSEFQRESIEALTGFIENSELSGKDLLLKKTCEVIKNKYEACNEYNNSICWDNVSRILSSFQRIHN